MQHPQQFSLLIAPSTMHMHGAVWPRHIVSILFIVVVALFLTRPTGGVMQETAEAIFAMFDTSDEALLPLPEPRK